MTDKELFDAMRDIDEKYILEAAPKEKSERGRWKKWVALAACLCLLVAGALQLVNWLGRDTGEDPTGNGIWTYAGKESDVVHFVKLSNQFLRAELMISAPGMKHFAPEKDACVVLFGQYISLAADFDYRSHFKMYPEKLVESAFTNRMEQEGLSFEDGLANIESTLQKILCYDELTVSYTVKGFESYRPGEEGYAAMFDGYEEWFSQAGVPSDEISEVRVYYFTDFVRVFGGQYKEVDFSGLDLERGFRFYKYKDKWHMWPTTIEDDLSVDLALTPYRQHHSYLTLFEVSGTVTAIEGAYVAMDDNSRYYAPEAVSGLEIGDHVQISYYKNFGLIIQGEEDHLTLYRAESVQKQGA